MKTVKQIADEAGVNVQTVYRRLNSVKQKSNAILTEKVGGITYFTEVGEKIIIECLTPVKQMLNDDKAENAEILFLREQIKTLNAQIEKLTETINIQAQSINAAHQNELAETIIDGKNIALIEDGIKKKRRSFWQFWKK